MDTERIFIRAVDGHAYFLVKRPGNSASICQDCALGSAQKHSTLLYSSGYGCGFVKYKLSKGEICQEEFAASQELVPKLAKKNIVPLSFHERFPCSHLFKEKTGEALTSREDFDVFLVKEKAFPTEQMSLFQ